MRVTYLCNEIQDMRKAANSHLVPSEGREKVRQFLNQCVVVRGIVPSERANLQHVVRLKHTDSNRAAYLVLKAERLDTLSKLLGKV